MKLKYIFIFLIFFLPHLTHATTTTLLPTISIVASSTNPNVYIHTFDTSILESIGGLFAREHRLIAINPSGTSSIQCYPLAGGLSGFNASETIETDISISHSGNTSSGANPCTQTGYYFHTFHKIGETDYYYAQYYYNSETNTINTFSGQLPTITPNFSNKTNTRFIDLLIQNSGGNQFDFTVTYYIDPTEASSTIQSLNTQDIRITWNRNKYSPNDISLIEPINNDLHYVFYSDHIPLQQGTESTEIAQFTHVVCPVSTDPDYELDTFYKTELLHQFYNFGASFNGNVPFQHTYINSTVIAHLDEFGDCTIQDYQNEPYNAVLSNLKTFEECGITSGELLMGCVKNTVMYLFVPSEQAINQMTDVFTDSNLEIIQVAYLAFNQITLASETQTPVSAPLSLNLTIPEADLDVEMFSVEKMTYLMGDALPIFRGIILVAIWIGFILMVFSTINRFITVRGERDNRYV